MTEYWEKVIGFDGLYEVSNLGRIRNRFGRVLKPYCRKDDGYYTVPLSRNGKVIRAYLHRVVARAFKGEPPEGHEVAHEDGDKSHNAPVNLTWKTRADNIRDNWRLGKMLMGEAHGMSVFTEETVLLARRLKAEGIPERAIALQAGVSRWTLRDMLKGKTWSHV